MLWIFRQLEKFGYNREYLWVKLDESTFQSFFMLLSTPSSMKIGCDWTLGVRLESFIVFKEYAKKNEITIESSL